MAAALNAFMKIGGAEGESKQAPYNTPPWIELQAWDWEVEAESSWTKGGGAAVGKPSPGKLNWEHVFDRSSNTILAYICTGKSFPEVTLEMCKSTGSSKGRQVFFKVTMNEVFITKVTQAATEEGNVSQKVEMVFKKIEIAYSQQGVAAGSPGALSDAGTFMWDIPSGEASPAIGG
ncbi:MAG: type VI secretion system tube protein Hcp [Caldimonas sp.]